MKNIGKDIEVLVGRERSHRSWRHRRPHDEKEIVDARRAPTKKIGHTLARVPPLHEARAREGRRRSIREVGPVAGGAGVAVESPSSLGLSDGVEPVRLGLRFRRVHRRGEHDPGAEYGFRSHHGPPKVRKSAGILQYATLRPALTPPRPGCHSAPVSLAVVLAVVAMVEGQANAYRAPRASDGHPALNGIT